jgi:hypothetical protein
LAADETESSSGEKIVSDEKTVADTKIVPAEKIVTLKNEEGDKLDILVRLSRYTIPLIQRLRAAAAAGKTVRQILSGLRSDRPEAPLEQLAADWVNLFQDSLKGGAIFLRDPFRQAAAS